MTQMHHGLVRLLRICHSAGSRVLRLGLHAEEVINLFALAIRAGLLAGDLNQMVYAYPTNASDINYMV